MRKPIVPLVLLTTLALIGGTAGAGAPAAPSVADDFVVPGTVVPLPPPGAAGLAAIRVQALAAHVAFLASPALEGRALGSRSLEAATEYAAAVLAQAGIPPIAGTSYFQPVPLREITNASGEVSVEVRDGARTRTRAFRAGADCLLPELPPQNLTAPVVFAGLGIREERLGRDDYRGLDVRGKAVLVLAGLPPGRDWQTEAMRSRYAAAKGAARWAARVQAARELGAAAVLAVEDDFAAHREEPSPATQFFLPFDHPTREEAPLVRVSPALAGFLLDTTASGSGSPRELPGASVAIRLTGEERFVTSRNVVAALAGADAVLREEAVVVGAHLDHLGAAAGGIYPGADDNASGVAAVLEIARAFAALPMRPTRTVVFAFWTGEEEGKLGSGYWVRHPLWPLQSTVAYLNLDMIGHPWLAEEIAKLVEESHLPGGKAFLASVTPADFAEPGLPPDAPGIAAALRGASLATGMALHLDRTDGTTGGSDYRDFARAHVPFVRFFGNFFPGYHEPGDTPETLDVKQVERMARLAFATAWLLASR